MNNDPRDEPVLIHPGAFSGCRAAPENVLIAVIRPYLSLARALALASWRKTRLDWGGLWIVPAKRGGFGIAGPAIGASVAATMLEALINGGAKRIIVTGCCGSLVEKARIGNLIIPSSAISEEGVSQHYAPDIYPPTADEELVELLKNIAAEKNYAHHTGPVWTTDAPYRETCAKVKAYGEQGVLGVEMELSALFTIARFRGVKLAASLAVSDELAALKWQPGFTRPAFLAATKAAVSLALDALKSLK